MLKKLFKFLFRILFWVLIALIVGVVVVYLTASMWIKPVVSSVVPKIMKTNVSLESADVSLFSGRFALKGLKVSNPEGFTEPFALELGEFSVQFQPKSVFTDKIIVDQVLIRGTQIVAEYNKAAQLNLMVLNDNIQESVNQGETTGAGNNQVKALEKSDTKSSKSVVIKDLQILNTSLRFAMVGRVSTLTLPDIQEKNIGEQKKTTLAQAIQLISEKLTVKPIQEMMKSSQNALKEAFKVIENHTTDRDAVKGLKAILSETNLF